MSKLSNSVNACLSKMAEVGGTKKGNYGEQAVFKICEQIYQKRGGILFHSYTYKVDEHLPGNIKRSPQGNLFIENLGSTTEIDILLVTKYKIYPIEVKAYKARKIILTDEAIEGCFMTEKSPVHQNEMHCRHLYSAILRGVPDGNTKYIEPIVVFADQCEVVDRRSDWQKNYIKVTILDRIKELIESLDKALEYEIDLKVMTKCLTEACTTSEAYLPYLQRGR